MACNCGIGGTRIAKRKIPTYDATKFDKIKPHTRLFICE